MLIRGSKDSMSFGEVLPEPGTEIKSSLFIHTDWQYLSTCCDALPLWLTLFMK